MGGTWVIQKCIPDPALDMNPRILANLLRNEENYLSVNYFKNGTQKDVKPWMRRMVTTWMLEVSEEQRCEPYVFALACNLLDRFLSVCTISRNELQLLGAACLLIASKGRETVTLSSAKLVIYTDNSITADQLLDMELLLLLKLKWDIMVPTTKDFLVELVNQLEQRKMFDAKHKQGIKTHAITFIDLITLDDEFLITPPSAIAACCLLSAILGNDSWAMGTDKDTILGELIELIGSDSDYLASMYGSVHASLEKTMKSNSSDDEDNNEMISPDTSQEIESSTTPLTTPGVSPVLTDESE